MPSSSFLKGIFFSATSSPVFQKSTELIIKLLPHYFYLQVFGFQHYSMGSFANPFQDIVLLHGSMKSRPPVISLACAHAHNLESLHTCRSLRVEYLTHTNPSLYEEDVCVLLSFQSEWAPCMVGLVCMYLCLCVCVCSVVCSYMYVRAR